MRKKVWVPLALGLLLLLLLPATSLADANDLKAAIDGKLKDSVGINSTWVIVAGCLVMFMQAGFAFLEIGFSRGKNAGTIIAKILVNFSIAAICYWAVGFAFAFGHGNGGNSIIGKSGTIYAGMAFTYTGSTAQSITVTSTSGLATQIAQIAKEASANSGSLQTQIDSLQTQDSTMQQKVNDINNAAAAFQNQLEMQYAKYQAAIQSADNTLNYLTAILNAKSR